MYVFGAIYVIEGLERGFLGEFSGRFGKEVRKRCKENNREMQRF